MDATKVRLARLLRRRRQPASEEERVATEEELRDVALEAAPPYRRAERRPQPEPEQR